MAPTAMHSDIGAIIPFIRTSLRRVRTKPSPVAGQKTDQRSIQSTEPIWRWSQTDPL